MSTPALLHTPVPWAGQTLHLYHGTTDNHAGSILAAVDVFQGKKFTDFGPGFYTTTLPRQAEYWAHQLSFARGVAPCVVEFAVSRQQLAMLSSLAFVRGDFDAEDFWSFVFYCRGGSKDHLRQSGDPLYDIVYGPVAADWRQRAIFQGADQIGFHTRRAEAVLNSSQRRRIL